MFAYCSGLCKAGGNDRDRVIAIAKTDSLVMFLAWFFSACKYGHADHPFGYTQYDAYDGGFIVPLPTFFDKRNLKYRARQVDYVMWLRVCVEFAGAKKKFRN